MLAIQGILLFRFQEGSNLQNNYEDNQNSPRKVHECNLNGKQNAFDVLPGSGWDNLANQELGNVLKITYKNCQTSNDGSFLIPDNAIVKPTRRSIIQLNSELFDHFNQYTSLTSKSINVDANYAQPNYQISGTFSWENKEVKNNQVKEKSTASRVQLRYELYSITIQPDSELDSKFRDRIIDIGALLKNGLDSLYPQYLADLVVRDFGTHVIRSVDAGAILSKTDILKSKYMKKMAGHTTNVSVTASYSMTKVMGINMKGDYGHDSQKLDEYNNNCASTKIDTIGGKSFGSNFSLDDWVASCTNNLVAVDRRGDPLYYVITARTLPEFDDETVYKISKLIKDAVNRYYSANTRIGCLNMQSPNFNDDANVDSGTCEDPVVFPNHGGMFQTCTGNVEQCREINQINPMTNGFSCPMHFETVRLDGGLNKCTKHCLKFFSIQIHCKYVCSYYELYWCSPSAGTTFSSGALFGGIYSDTYPNPITNGFNCPQNYMALKFGITGRLCLSLYTDKVSVASSVPFGGLYSCNMGNPLSKTIFPNTTTEAKYWTQNCASGFSDHMAVVNRGCQISYCVKGNTLSAREELPLIRPPFIDLTFGPNVTVVNSFQSSMGFQISKLGNGNWEDIDQYRSEHTAFILSCVFGTLFFVMFFSSFIYVMVVKCRQSRKVHPMKPYEKLDNNDAPGISKNLVYLKPKSTKITMMNENRPL